MDRATRETLHRAYHLIRGGDNDTARALIKPVLAAHKENSDAWWLAAHAASTPHDRRLALVQVLRIVPGHAAARVMLDRLNAENPQEVDELAKDLSLLPPPGQKSRDAVQPLARRPRWMWNVMLLFGCLSFMFASAALISGVAGLPWLDNAVSDVRKALGDDPGQGAGGQMIMVKGGDPNQPYDIPVTEKKDAKIGSEPNINTLKKDEAHIYTLYAQRGQEILALLQFTVAGDAHYVLELWDAGQRKLATGEGAQNSGTVTLVYEVRQTGQYALIIIGRPNGPRGDYALGVDVVD